jgi:hypothetical protein
MRDWSFWLILGTSFLLVGWFVFGNGYKTAFRYFDTIADQGIVIVDAMAL